MRLSSERVGMHRDSNVCVCREGVGLAFMVRSNIWARVAMVWEPMIPTQHPNSLMGYFCGNLKEGSGTYVCQQLATGLP